VNKEYGGGCSSSVVTNENIQRVEEAIMQDRRVTKQEIADSLGLNRTTVFRIIHERLCMTKVASRSVPHNLSSEHLCARVEMCKSWMSRYSAEGLQFLDRIVTMNEVWVHLYEPETKRQSMQWKHTDSPPPRKFRVERSAAKVM
jgi:histone-lysine N-methyltransferase SETMAR